MSLSVADFTIDNASGQAVRLDIQACFKALQGQSAETTDIGQGAAASTQCVAGMTFLNTGTNAGAGPTLKIRNSGNSAFTVIGPIDEPHLGLLPVAGGTMTGTLNFGSTAVTSIKETSANNNLAFLTNSTERWQINSAGTLFSLPNSSKASNTALNFLTDPGAAFYQVGNNFEALSLVKSGTDYATALYINRKGSGDGVFIALAKDDLLKCRISNDADGISINVLGSGSSNVAGALKFTVGNTDRWAVNVNGGFQWKQDQCRNKYDLGHPSSADASGTDVNSGIMRFAGLTSRRGTGSQAATANPYNFFWDDYSTGTTHLECYVDGSFVGDISGPTSDYRIKRNVALQTESGIDKVKNLKPITYQSKEYGVLKESDEIKEGFLAHEVQEVIPSAVNDEKDGDAIQSLNLDAIVSVLTKALQEAVAKIEILEAKVAALEAK